MSYSSSSTSSSFIIDRTAIFTACSEAENIGEQQQRRELQQRGYQFNNTNSCRLGACHSSDGAYTTYTALVTPGRHRKHDRRRIHAKHAERISDSTS